MTLGFISFIAAFFGAILASFLEVCADRLPKGEWPSGRSHCEQCGRPLSFVDLLPIFGWFIRRGVCVDCGVRIPFRHVVGEVALAVAFAVAVLSLETFDVWAIAFRLIMLSVLFGIIVADFRYYIIPDVFSLGAVAFLLLAHAAAFVWEMPYEHVLPGFAVAMWGLLFGVLFLGTFSFVSKGTWMGWGDVKLAAALGLAYGFPAILFILGFSFMFGAVVALVMVALRLRDMKGLLPFGPFIAFAALPFLFDLEILVYRTFGVLDFFPGFLR